MRGQHEKLTSDQANLKRYLDFLTKTLTLLEGGVQPAVGETAEAKADGSGVQALIEAQEEERRKISRQIHDGPAQDLSNFILQTEIALRLFDTDAERAREELNSLKASAASTFTHVRDFIFDLRPMMLDDLGLVPTVRRYAEALKEKTGLDITLVVTGTERRLESHREVLVFRALQQLLTNVRDHAQATQAKVLVDIDQRQVRASVEDNGKGFDPAILQGDETGVARSLRTLEERLRQVGGTFEADSAPGRGAKVSLAIPAGD
jgi:two-component system sensor histidine kinase DegS